MRDGYRRGVACAVLAAAFYALNSPLSKLLLGDVAPTMMAAFLYLGAGLGMAALQWLRGRSGRAGREQPLTRTELPFTIGMVALDIAAPIALMVGLSRTTAANASLLNNFEIVATSLIALICFGEAISRKLCFSFSSGSVWVLAACVCWGFENNCTRRLSSKDPVEIVVIKGVFSGLGSLLIALCLDEPLPAWLPAMWALGLGFVAYGLSIALYIYAQRELGAAKTSAYYAVAPFIGVVLSLAIFRDIPSTGFIAALLVMIAGTWCVTRAEGAA